MSIIRTERSQALWSPETTFGTMVTPARRFGIHDTLVAPDPDYKWVPFFGVGSRSRSRDTILRGPQDLRGSIPDIRMQGNADLPFLLAQILGNRIVSGSNSIIYESGYLAAGLTDGRIPSMTMQVAMRDTDGVAQLVRNFIGGKVNRATLAANEGEELRLSLEEMMFLEERHNKVGVFGYDAAVATASDPGLDDAGRFIFAGANVIIAGVTMARLRRVNLSIDNQLEYRYYLKLTGGAPRLQLPNDIVEGKRVYKLEAEIDIGDPNTDLEFFEYLRMEGAASTSSKTSGTQISMVFLQQPSEGSHSLTIVCSASPNTVYPGSVFTSAKHNIPAPPAGLIPVTLSADVNEVYMVYA